MNIKSTWKTASQVITTGEIRVGKCYYRAVCARFPDKFSLTVQKLFWKPESNEDNVRILKEKVLWVFGADEELAKEICKLVVVQMEKE